MSSGRGGGRPGREVDVREPARWRLRIEDLDRRPAPGLDAPELIRFTPDGAAVTYLHGPGLVRSLWRLDLETGERRRIVAAAEGGAPADRAEELRRERTRTYAEGVTRYAWSGTAARPVLLVPAGGRWLVGVGSDPSPQPLAALDGATEARLSRDGGSVAFVRDGDVWVTSADGDGSPRRITDDACDGVTNGLAEYIAAEELKRFDGMWWSADGARLAIARVDERGVGEVTIAHLGTSEELERHRYPRPGEANAHVSLRLADVATGELRDVALPMEPDDYLARVVPLPDGRFLAAVLPRSQHELRWMTVDRDGKVTPGWVEEGGAWVNLDDDTRALDDGRIVRTTERSGYRHLEVRDADGTGRRLTDGAWVVTRLVDVDRGRDEAVFLATRDGATERHAYAVPLDGGEPRRLTSEPGWHDVVLADDGGHWTDAWSTLATAPAAVVRDRSGEVVREIHAPSTDAASIGLPPPRLIEVTAADGATPLHAALYAAETADEPPPLVVSIYGGPHSQRVMDAWGMTVDLTAQLLAQRGISVLTLDNRGTYNRGVAFEAPLHRRLGGVEVDDTAAAVRQLVARGLADAERIGITGWSYGGYMVLRCMLAEPGLFGTGVAGAPVVDWALYDTAYTERYLGDPRTDPEPYRLSGVADGVGALTGRLLVIHGVIDENVHLRHTARLVAALVAADRDHDLLLLPGERHGVRGPQAVRHRFARTVRHLEETLLRPPS